MTQEGKQKGADGESRQHGVDQMGMRETDRRERWASCGSRAAPATDGTGGMIASRSEV